MPNFLDELNDVQRAAVTHEKGAALVVAGPGSGKTRVLTYRIANLIEQGVAPWNILSLTFTNKSAKEMKERIALVVGEERASRVWAGTFHSIFARLLRSEATKIGYTSNFTIYDSEDSKSLLRTIIKELNLAKETYNENAILTRISSAKTNLISPKAYEQNNELMVQDQATKRPFIHKIYQEYINRCKRSDAMDFDDLLYQTFILLHQNEDVLAKYRARFTHFLVDEFQDTNHLQYAILKKLAKYPGSNENIAVVGDDAQSIYAFRGATIENILNFEKDFSALKVFKLEQNYRSTPHIVDAANEVITNNRRQIKKTIWTDKPDGQRIKVIKSATDHEEAKRVADLILEQKNRYHLLNSDIAILYRTNAQSRTFEEALRRLNLQYRVYGGMSFYQRKEVKDVIAYLRLITNPNDDEALRRIINFPRRSIGDATVEKLGALAAEKNQSLWSTLPAYEGTPREKNALQSFIALMTTAMQRALKANAYEMAQFIVKQSGLLDTLKLDTTLEGIGRMDNVNALLDAISEFVNNDEVIDEATVPDKSLQTYLQNIALIADFNQNDGENKSTDVITLMSVHSAKGLEFKSVIVGGMEEGLFPSFMSQDTPEGYDEERRLFYVAITRAQQFLALTYATSRYKFGQMKYAEPSSFLNEIDAKHLEGMGSLSGFKKAAPVIERARVTGNFKPFSKPNAPMIDEKDFKPSATEKIKEKMNVLHLRFGKGEVRGIEGGKDNPIAAIYFEDAKEIKKIALKFAKLQILE